MLGNKNNATCCSCGTGCRGTTNDDAEVTKRCIEIDFLYLDVTVRERCKGTDENLDDALSEVLKVLEAMKVNENE